MEGVGRRKSVFGRRWKASVDRRDWCRGRRRLTRIDRLTCELSIDEERIPLRIERSKLAGSDENSRISIDTLVETSTDYSIGISIDALGQALMRGLNMLTKLTRSALAYSSKS
ncbi:hypothetical protein F2Q69_00021716 [Brassica cretica]|uniref:Uncharacterized protein n=1 Tax=Brassica cretica TaxID=69181 RepID=A0A8S9QEA3_BRACR|nr:hypothetical protein F2Q69_00021716 [Brassica cretica]